MDKVHGSLEDLNPTISRRIVQPYGQVSRPSDLTDRIPTGIKGFDDLIEGGLPRGRLILIMGEPGAGKTVFCSQFLYTGIQKHGENGLYVSLKETRTDYLREMKRFGLDLLSAENDGKFSFIDASPGGDGKDSKLAIGDPKFSLQSLLGEIESLSQKINAQRIVVDSLATLDFELIEPLARRKMLLKVSETLSKTDATCLLTSDLTSIGMGGIVEFENYLRNSLVQLEKHWFHGTVVMQTLTFRGGATKSRTIRIEKMRETSIDQQPRPYVISDNGIEVYPDEVFSLPA